MNPTKTTASTTIDIVCDIINNNNIIIIKQNLIKNI